MEDSKLEELYQKAGKLYQSGQYAQAVPLLETLAEEGIVVAQISLATCYYEGLGVAKNATTGTYWIFKAAKQGDADAQYVYGTCLETGNGIAKDPIKFLEWYLNAAEQGHAKATAALASCYMEGKGFPKDMQRGVELYVKAAELGDPDAKKFVDDLVARGAIRLE